MRNIEVSLNGEPISPEIQAQDGAVTLSFREPLLLAANETLEIVTR